MGQGRVEVKDGGRGGARGKGEQICVFVWVHSSGVCRGISALN